MLEVPQQPESSNDCALFIVAYTEFFIYAQLHNKTPGFLTPSWFRPDNAGLMREHIRYGMGGSYGSRGTYARWGAYGGDAHTRQ